MLHLAIFKLETYNFSSVAWKKMEFDLNGIFLVCKDIFSAYYTQCKEQTTFGSKKIAPVFRVIWRNFTHM